jgi:prepilin peptidase CpaA
MNMPLVLMLLWVGLILAAAISDFRFLRIPNVYPVLIIILFIVSRLMGGFGAEHWSHLYHFLITLGIGMLLFHLCWFGGGDAKLYAAIALWFGLSSGVMFIFATGMSGLALAIFYVVMRQLRRRSTNPPPEKKRNERRIPYGIAIAMGGMLTALDVGLNTLFPGATTIFGS